MSQHVHGLTRYKKGPDEHGTPGKGCRCTRCREANSTWQRNRGRMIAYGRWEGLPDATGTRRRLQALMWCGWSLGALASRCDCSRQVLRRKLLVSDRCTVSTARQVRALYDELWDQSPPGRDKFERRAATMARRYAREHGWAAPAAWNDDEIDNPDAQPVPGWQRHGRGVGMEDTVELDGYGVHPEMIAARLGLTPGTVQWYLHRGRQVA